MKKILFVILPIMTMLIIGTTGVYANTENICGDSITWEITENTLKLYGSGDMYSYPSIWSNEKQKSYSTAPWKDYVLDIKYVEIQEGITNIGDYAFSGCQNLVSISIPSSVSSLGTRMVEYCNNLVDINIPCSVQTIKFGAFADCQGITHIEIPEGVLSIEAGTFAWCSNLTSVILPNSVKFIGNNAFGDCHKLVYINLSDNVEQIDNYAFMGCGELSSITLPKSLKSIGKSAFYAERLNTIYYRSTIDDWDAIEINEENDFSGIEIQYSCAFPKIIAFGDCGKNVSWKYDTSHKLTIYGDGFIEDYDTVWNDGFGFSRTDAPWGEWFNEITTIDIQEGITEIGNNAFSGCSSLYEINFSTTITTINQGAFFACYSLNKVTIPENIKIVDKSFTACKSLYEVRIPSKIQEINAFSRCDKLLNIYYNNTNVEWAKLNIEYGNDFSNATIHYSDIDNNNYVINYFLNGGGVLEAGWHNINSTISPLNETSFITNYVPQKEGYKFIGWSSINNSNQIDYTTGQIYTGNDNLNLYAIWQNIPYTQISMSYSDDTITCMVDLFNITEDCYIIAAQYQSERLAKIEIRKITSNYEEFVMDKNNDTVKIMVWKDLKTIKPITELKEMSIESFDETPAVTEPNPIPNSNIY